jgi:hypothetical protein
MKAFHILSDHHHPDIVAKARQLSIGRFTPMEQLDSLFHFVRDEIEFGFPPQASQWDRMKASEVLALGKGYCNTKATLLLALCRALEIPARVHYSTIDINIMRGILPWFAFPFLPRYVNHSWLEVQLRDEWKPLDSYVNDLPFYKGCRLELGERKLGYSLSFIDGKCSETFNFGEEGFVHMGAVHEDLGAFEDAGQFFATEAYRPLTAFQRLTYPLMVKTANRRIARIRREGELLLKVGQLAAVGSPQ